MKHLERNVYFCVLPRPSQSRDVSLNTLHVLTKSLNLDDKTEDFYHLYQTFVVFISVFYWGI